MPGAIELHASAGQGENSVVAAESDIFSRKKFRAALPYDDVAGQDQLAPEFLYPKPFADAVAPVLNTALSFFVSHLKKFRVVGS